MANFFLVDQSLRDSSGHHFDYVHNVALAAMEKGFKTIIGTHCRLPKNSLGHKKCSLSGSIVRRAFRQTMYQPDSYLAGVQHLTRSRSNLRSRDNTSGLWHRSLAQIRSLRHGQRRDHAIRKFAVDCEKFFRPSVFTENDQAFFAAVSELELMGLAALLANQPRSVQVRWHLQFHFNLFDGRPPEYAKQSNTTKVVRSCFLAALARLSFHDVRFYTTSEELSDQYNQLGVTDFESLPYPIAPEFTPEKAIHLPGQRAAESILDYAVEDASSLSASALTQHKQSFFPTNENTKPGSVKRSQYLNEEASQIQSADNAATPSSFFQTQPIRVTCPGGIRREKGHAQYLQQLIDEIWEPLLASGNIQLQLQRPKRKSLQKEKLELDHPGSSLSEHQPLVYLPHPLPRDKYVELIRTTDIGLLFYDSRAYYSRRAGVLGELLSCGKPVIVPAGCWLAEQIQEPIFEHADEVVARRQVRRIGLADFHWESCNVPMLGGILSFDAEKHPFNFDVQLDSSESLAAIRFDWHWPSKRGVYCRIELNQFDQSGDLVASHCQVVGHRDLRKPIALFSVDPSASKLRFSLKNAFHHSTASIKNVEIVTLYGECKASRDGTTPLGKVGVIAADQSQLSNCIHEVLNHIDHYRQSSQRFSRQWFAQHEPSRTLTHLLADDSMSGNSGSGVVFTGGQLR